MLEEVSKAAISGAVKLPEPLMTTAQAAQYLNVGKSTLEQYRVHGDGPLYVKISASVRYRRSDLDAWVAARVTKSTSAAQRAA